MTKELRNQLKDQLIENFLECSKDWDWRVEVANNGFKGIQNMTDQELVDEYLSTYDSEAGYIHDIIPIEDGTIDDIDEEDKELMKTPEYRTHWEKVKV